MLGRQLPDGKRQKAYFKFMLTYEWRVGKWRSSESIVFNLPAFIDSDGRSWQGATIEVFDAIVPVRWHAHWSKCVWGAADLTSSELTGKVYEFQRKFLSEVWAEFQMLVTQRTALPGFRGFHGTAIQCAMQYLSWRFPWP